MEWTSRAFLLATTGRRTLSIGTRCASALPHCQVERRVFLPVAEMLLDVLCATSSSISVLPLVDNATKWHYETSYTGGILHNIETVEPTLYGDAIGVAPELVNGDLLKPSIDHQVGYGVPHS
jgi:hypothetical protein